MKSGILVLVLTLAAMRPVLAQEGKIKIWNPATDSIQCLEGQAWAGSGKNVFARLPANLENKVRKEVWNLSQHTAGLSLRFRTNASELTVRYTVKGGHQMPHMPATGVSGMDLYSKSIDGQWLWCAGRYTFGDTLSYRFVNLPSKDQHVSNWEYTLYLPLYNSIKWMEISMPAECEWKPLPVRKEKPVIVYGTSIAQGGCASRPGLAWTNILARKLNSPVVNLGFSGNGRLETEILELMGKTDAKAYILDCLPNLMPPAFTGEEVKKRIQQAVGLLRKARPEVPILLTDHDGYTDEAMNEARRKDYTGVNQALHEILYSMRKEGIGGLYHLPKAEINQDIETMVDGVHPNDIGMMRYAEAYERILRKILDMEDGGTVTTTAVTQRRDARIYDWETRHEEILDYNKNHQPEIVFLGNSITHFWGGLPPNPVNNGPEAWNKNFGSRRTVNMGFGWDRVENVLWRVHHGTLDGFKAKQIVLMIGTNNLHLNTDEEIVEGLRYLIQAIQSKQPQSMILLMGILPRRNTEERVVQINKKIANLASGKNIQYADAGPLFVRADQKIDEALFTDGLHPNEMGYDRLGGFIIRWMDQ